MLQEVVGAQVRGIAAELGGGDGLAVQPLLQVGEGGDRAVVAADQQLAVEHGVEVERVDQVGEGAGDVVAGAGVEPAAVPASAAAWTRMPSHFHSAAKSAGSRRAKSRLLERVGEHDRAERGARRPAPGCGPVPVSQAKSGT